MPTAVLFELASVAVERAVTAPPFARDLGWRWATAVDFVGRILGPSLTRYARQVFAAHALPEIIVGAIVVVACIGVAQLIRG